MARTNDNSIPERIRRAGCWANGLYAFAIFFALGAIISLINTDAIRALGGLFLTAICVGGGIWLARRAGNATAPPSAPSKPAAATRTPRSTPRTAPRKRASK